MPFGVAEGINGWQEKRLPTTIGPTPIGSFRRLMITGFLTEFAMRQSRNGFCAMCLAFLLPFVWQVRLPAQQTPAAASSPNVSPSPTPPVFSTPTLSELKQLQRAALESDYAYRQVAHLANNIGPRLSGSAQAAKAVEYVAGELTALGCEVQPERVRVPRWVRGAETAPPAQLPHPAPRHA